VRVYAAVHHSRARPCVDGVSVFRWASMPPRQRIETLQRLWRCHVLRELEAEGATETGDWPRCWAAGQGSGAHTFEAAQRRPHTS